MNKDFILKHTRNYDEWLIGRLKDPEEARGYLEASLEEYEKDGDTMALLLAMRDVAQAQGRIGKLAKRTAVSREHLYEILANQQTPRWDHWLAVLSALGFRFRLERQTLPIESSPLQEKTPA